MKPECSLCSRPDESLAGATPATIVPLILEAGLGIGLFLAFMTADRLLV